MNERGFTAQSISVGIGISAAINGFKICRAMSSWKGYCFLILTDHRKPLVLPFQQQLGRVSISL